MIKVGFDIGHGGSDPGAVNGKRKEKDDALKLAKAVEKYVEEKTGKKVDCQKSRLDDKFLSLSARSAWANRNNYKCLISFHRDWAKTNASGLTVRVQTGQLNKNAGKLAKCITKRTNKFYKGDRADNDNVIEDNLHITRETKMPAVLVEAGFISNGNDNKIFDNKFNELVKSIGDGLIEYLGVKVVNKPSDKPKPKPEASNNKKETYYRVCVGSYKEKKNAEEQQAKLKKAGFDSFLVAYTE